MLARFIRQHTASNHLLVFIQFFGIALCCYPVGLQNHGSPLWLILCALGSMLGVLALGFNKIGNFSVYPEIKSHAKLITTGPYRFIRHPMYSALIIMMLGITLYNFHPINAIGAVMVPFAVINKANIEEKLLLEKFSEYAIYQQTSKRFLPYLY